ncbi:hypothetical protein RHMOL_Rhmol04G0146400 [Rhododendron molle]|uniref:Uncharacterized protein n=1 Tax=Rhododendron molle TaxID=49168 RepID=A0ACC0P0E9_RHOML|nr:hypothetical protein RHMOL_Rhmol04G0146400 [Rhododendron molle]
MARGRIRARLRRSNLYTFACIRPQDGEREEPHQFQGLGFSRIVFYNEPCRHVQKALKYWSNYISTTKYNVITFLPKATFKQFRRVANLYFLLAACPSFTKVSPFSIVSMVAPLAFVIGLSMAKEAMEDWRSEVELAGARQMALNVDGQASESTPKSGVHVSEIELETVVTWGTKFSICWTLPAKGRECLLLFKTRMASFFSFVKFRFGLCSIIFDQLSKNVRMYEKASTKHLKDYGEGGLLTLALAYQKLEEAEYFAWNNEFIKAKTSIGGDREVMLERVSDLMERDLILVGATAMEDKMQKGCIDKLAQACLKIWVLTGDKLEIAINIGRDGGKAVRQQGTGKITLAIGDGANDVRMIQEADIGVGISGVEGMQAVVASDFSIAQFRFLEILVAVHGHWCYKRIAQMVIIQENDIGVTLRMILFLPNSIITLDWK